MVDRFDSNETPEWHPEAFSQGFMARMNGFDMDSQNYFQLGSWGWKSFRAGWADCDMDTEAPKEEIR